MAEEYKFETRCIHGNGGLVEGHPYGAVSVPIFQTATFAHLHIRELEEVPDTTTPVRAIRQGMSLKV